MCDIEHSPENMSSSQWRHWLNAAARAEHLILAAAVTGRLVSELAIVRSGKK